MEDVEKEHMHTIKEYKWLSTQASSLWEIWLTEIAQESAMIQEKAYEEELLQMLRRKKIRERHRRIQQQIHKG